MSVIVLALCYDDACVGDADGRGTQKNASKELMQITGYQILANKSTNIGGYRYFFNGQEDDNEVFGETANFGYEFRQYDSRLARWWSVDPKWNEYPSVSPYVFCNGSPIMMMDPNGEEASEKSSLMTGAEIDFKLDLKLEFKPFISLTEPPKGGKLQELKEKISNGLHRIDMAIANPYSPDPFEGHGDAWERKFAEKTEPYAMGGALMIPSWGIPNALITTATRKDIYGIKADKNEIGSAWISLGFTIVELAFPEFKSVNLIYNGVSNTFEIKKYKKQQDEEK